MVKKFLLRSMLALAVLTCAFAFLAMGAPSAHAAGIAPSNSSRHVVWTHTTKKVIPGPKAWCNEMIKKYPKLAANPQGCNIVITSQDTLYQSGTSYSSVAQPATSCPSGDLFHDVKENSSLNLSGAEMREDFIYHGNCSFPSVTNQDCSFNMWSYFPYAGITNTKCYSFTNGSHTIAQGNYQITGSVGAGSFSAVIQTAVSGSFWAATDSTSF